MNSQTNKWETANFQCLIEEKEKGDERLGFTGKEIKETQEVQLELAKHGRFKKQIHMTAVRGRGAWEETSKNVWKLSQYVMNLLQGTDMILPVLMKDGRGSSWEPESLEAPLVDQTKDSNTWEFDGVEFLYAQHNREKTSIQGGTHLYKCHHSEIKVI